MTLERHGMDSNAGALEPEKFVVLVKGMTLERHGRYSNARALEQEKIPSPSLLLLAGDMYKSQKFQKFCDC